jgi:hypothetical protein
VLAVEGDANGLQRDTRVAVTPQLLLKTNLASASTSVREGDGPGSTYIYKNGAIGDRIC